MTCLKFLLTPLILSIFMMAGLAQAQEKQLPKFFVGYSLLGKDEKLHSLDENHPELAAKLDATRSAAARSDGYIGVERITQKSSNNAILSWGINFSNKFAGEIRYYDITDVEHSHEALRLLRRASYIRKTVVSSSAYGVSARYRFFSRSPKSNFYGRGGLVSWSATTKQSDIAPAGGSVPADAPVTLENSGISPILGVGYERYFNDAIGFKVEIAPFKVEYKSGKESYTTGLELGLFTAF